MSVNLTRFAAAAWKQSTRAIIFTVVVVLITLSVVSPSTSAIGPVTRPGPDWNGRGQNQSYFDGTPVGGSNAQYACPWSMAGNGTCNGADDHENFVLSADPACNGSAEAIPIACIGKVNESDQQRVKELISYLEFDNNQGAGTRNRAGSGFIYNTLMGRDAANNIGRHISGAGWQGLETLIDEDLKDGLITIWWNTKIESYYRTYGVYDRTTHNGDVAYYMGPPGHQNDDAIIFRNAAGNPIYVLYRPCGNPGGNIQGLPRPPSVTASCEGATVTPARPDSFTPFIVAATIGYKPPSGAGVAFGPDTMHIKLTGPSPNTRTVYNSSTTNPTNNGDGTVTYRVTVPAQSPGIYTITYWTTGSVSPISCAGGNVTVADEPYLSVKGGDASVGAGMTVGSTNCAIAPDQKAGIVGWNNEGSPNYGGAGTSFAAFALNRLQDFVSAQNNNPLEPSGLSFANDVASGAVDTANGFYGGGFGPNAIGCIHDYFADATHATTHSGNVTIPGSLGVPANGQIANGSKTVLYVKGNVYIDGNGITFSGSYGTVKDIPALDVIVEPDAAGNGGNIYIAPGVKELDGLYVAQPDAAGHGGFIYTCTAAAFTKQPLDSSIYGNCGGAGGSTLTVDGAFVAKQVWLERSYGSVNGQPAERINFSPEIWLNAPPTTTTDQYDAITSLPPVL